MNSTDEINRPSKFWAKLAAKNDYMLSQEGLTNFKRTVANNYYNWAVLSVQHGLFQPALRRWLSQLDSIPFRVELPEMEMLRKQQSDLRIAVTWKQRQVYRFYVGMIWSIMRRLDNLGISKHITEPSIGNPFPTRLDGKLISQDLANSIIECNTICSLVDSMRPLRIAEIGAGYGRLAHVFTKIVDCEYHIVDIEPARSIAAWYLNQVTDMTKIRLRKPEDIKSLPDGYFDVVLSISTLPEMSEEQVSIYIREFQRLSRGIIFLKQWKSWDNPDDGITANMSSYRFNSHWKNVLNITDPLNTKFFNAAWRNSTGQPT